MDDRNARGGRREADVKTDTGCEAACLAKSFEECRAFDFNTLDKSCWLHKDAPSSLRPANGINHFTRTKCLGLCLFQSFQKVGTSNLCAVTTAMRTKAKKFAICRSVQGHVHESEQQKRTRRHQGGGRGQRRWMSGSLCGESIRPVWSLRLQHTDQNVLVTQNRTFWSEPDVQC